MTLKPIFFRATRRYSAAVASIVMALACLNANAVLMYAYNFSGDRLISFNSATPGTIISDVAISGLVPPEDVLDIAVRPATGELYGFVSNLTNSRIVKINPVTGAITTVGVPFLSTTPGTFFGIAFSPSADRLRLVSDGDANARYNPDAGTLSATDTNLAYVAGDVNASANPAVVHAAYTNTFFGATSATLYGIDSTTNALVRIGGFDGLPSPNSGALTTVGPLGVTIGSFGGFAIAPRGNVAYAALRVAGVSVLHSINLSTGAATAIGPIGSGTTIDGLAISLIDECLDLDGDGIASAPTDGLMLIRALLGMTGTSVTTNAIPTPAPPRSTWTAIRTHMNTNCGTRFAP